MNKQWYLEPLAKLICPHFVDATYVGHMKRGNSIIIIIHVIIMSCINIINDCLLYAGCVSAFSLANPPPLR